MNIFRLAVSRPIATSMVFIAIMVFGIYSYIRLPVDLFPEVDSPIISVITSYEGAGALEVERNVTEHLESVLGTTPELLEITSTSMDNVSVVTLEFNGGANMDEATNNVRDRLGQAEFLLPDDVNDPILQKFDASAIPVVIYSVTADESYPELEQIIDDYIVNPLNRISGVGDVSVTGAPSREVQVVLDPERLRAYNLDVPQIAQALQAENISSPAGRVDLGTESYNLRVNTEFRSVDDIGGVIVANYQGRQVTLDQVASIREGFADEDAISRVNGRQGLTFAVQKQTEANTVEVSERVMAQMPAIAESLPDDVEMTLIIDTSDFIVDAINNLSSVLFYAVVFVVLVVLIFLRQWRATIVIAATIPVSLIVGFIYLTLVGSTLNMISLSSLSIALGMVVDDAIVVLENIMQHIERGSTPREAAIHGTGEVGVAVVATTLTVVAVFLPLTFLEGQTGVWFGQLGAIVVVTVVTSTVAALTLTPMMGSLMMKPVDEKGRGPLKALARGIDKGLRGIEAVYRGALGVAVRFRKTTMLAALAVFGLSVALVPRVGTEFMPISDDGFVTVSGELETSRSLEYTSEVVTRLEAQITEEVPELKRLNSTSGTSGSMFGGVGGGKNEFQLRMELIDQDDRERSVFEVADQVRGIMAGTPEIVTSTVTAGNSGGAGSAQPVAVEIRGFNLEQTTALARDLAEHMEGIEGTRDVNLSRGESRPEFEIIFDRERLSDFGLTSAQVAQVVRGNIAGQTATIFRRDGDEYDVVLRYAEGERSSLEQVREMTVNTPSGARVRLEDLGEIKEFMVPPNIERIDRERMLTVSAGIEGRPLNLVMEDVREWVDAQNLPPQIAITYGGDFQEQQESFQDLFLILALSLILVYLVMAGQFESLKEPFVIMFSIPFAFTGVILALLITNTPLSVIGLIGAIILVGIVVKNAIVLIDYIKLLQGRGQPIFEAIVDGSVSRLRPVLMTTLTTILAMIPLALEIGEGAELWKPMAISVIGGLSFSTVVTLIIVPVLYGMFERNAKTETGGMT
ncbi:efflux RND transporter permease subunit [Lujinxingia vulgaris]|uniref:Efflux RND transporter permease subunit n=1 Tax=Lujinxingia vulgaris TaxID=2600176 RepID=A0A5C6X9A8_9DELT|nr:efflux RND transporter permease subunit [Lujinxingia vulgaris]TXD37950.1 efflux RND transporter permease subunit [Lujinxingia vulgaris]